MAISAGLLAAACFELWRGRYERLLARWPLIAVMGFHAIVFMAGAFDVVAGNEPMTRVPPLLSWFSLVQLEFVMFLLAAAVLAVMMCRERVDARLLAVASVDSLTGIANRAAFFDRATRILNRAAQDGTSLVLILFDLDNFKTINDTYGHAGGDLTLRAFADVARANIRPADLIGRIGGEEFCLVLYDASLEEGFLVAERIRNAFAASPIPFGRSTIVATVSAGVATNTRAATVEALVEAADRALYRAKSAGRNRVERVRETVKRAG
jgi:diguanylate cyclase (GGDEF)-like protein